MVSILSERTPFVNLDSGGAPAYPSSCKITP